MSDAEVPEADALDQSMAVDSDVAADAGAAPRLDPEAPEADALEQSAPVHGVAAGEPTIGTEVPEADALDQAVDVGDEDDHR